jgi:hypothetical protein
MHLFILGLEIGFIMLLYQFLHTVVNLIISIFQPQNHFSRQFLHQQNKATGVLFLEQTSAAF